MWRIYAPFTSVSSSCDSIAAMRKVVVTYSSVYGSSRKYAEALAGRIGATASDASSPDLSDVDLVVHFGGLYAGTMAGLKRVVGRMPDGSSLYAVSVGIADPCVERNAKAIDDVIWKHIPDGMKDRVRIFHLRGRLDYPAMTARHRAMMWMLCRWIRGRKERSEEDQMVLDTYGSVVDFIDLESLDPLVSAIEAWRQ